MSNTEARHLELKEKLILCAKEIVIENGLSGLKSREVTTRAGCSLGTLYNVMGDLDTLIMHVNAETLRRLGKSLVIASEAAGPDAEERLLALADAYIDFAMENRNLWLALFQFHPSEGEEIPDWYRDNHLPLIALIIEPLGEVLPGIDRDMLYLRARTTFTAVHGIVIFTLEQGYVAVPLENLRSEVHEVVRMMLLAARDFAARDFAQTGS